MQLKTFFNKHPVIKDMSNILFFIALVAIGTLFINAYIFRTFNVVGPSMEGTLSTDDRLIVDRIPVTIAKLQNKEYVPERGQVIVFKNPKFAVMQRDEYIVKRVIAFAGETVDLKDGQFTVYSDLYPDGINPDDFSKDKPKSPTQGELDNFVVPNGDIFVAGDNRIGSSSYDSRNGLGTVPLYDIVGPVSFRIFPFTGLRNF